ncbi:MAG TPA: FGGY family carbohydrate kinase [Acidimicrobiia bacterium]|nr:FGGY family carbohydrate kinase [Acidimicrobiia bacterium]
MSGGLLLGLDIGTSRIKAVVLDATGAERATVRRPTPFVTSALGVEMDVPVLASALQEAVAGLGPLTRDVAAVGVAGMAESGTPLRDDRPLAPIIAWHDGRGEDTVAALEKRFGPSLALWTGRQVRTVSSVAKLGWLLDHGLAEVPDRWLGVPELALFFLTGAEATEYSLAARTGAYHVIERYWLPEVAGALGIGASVFPTVRAAGTVMGFVTEEAAALFGLRAEVPVTIAGHDHLAAAAGLGARPGDLLNSVGTAETVIRQLDEPPDVAAALELGLAVTLWPGGEAWALLASAARAGLVIEALAAELGVSVEALDTLEPPGAQRWAQTQRELSERTAEAAARVAALAGPHDRLVVFGGGSRSRSWLEAKAAATGVPVLAVEVSEAAARGAALAAGVAAGWWPATALTP